MNYWQLCGSVCSEGDPGSLRSLLGLVVVEAAIAIACLRWLVDELHLK